MKDDTKVCITCNQSKGVGSDHLCLATQVNRLPNQTRTANLTGPSGARKATTLKTKLARFCSELLLTSDQSDSSYHFICGSFVIAVMWQAVQSVSHSHVSTKLAWQGARSALFAAAKLMTQRVQNRKRELKL